MVGLITFQKILNRRNLISLLLLFFIFSISLSVFGQANQTHYAIKKYGKTIEQPFHSANNFREDSLGQLLFDTGTNTWAFNGENFYIKNTGPTNSFEKFLAEKDGSVWYGKGNFEALYYTSDSTFTLDISPYGKKGTITDIYKVENSVYLLANYVLVKYRFNKDHFTLEKVIELPEVDARSMHIMGDTIVIRTLNQSRYLLESNPNEIIPFGPDDLSDWANGIIYLPNNKILLQTVERDTIISDNSPIHQAILAFGDNKIVTHLLDRQGSLWITTYQEGLLRYDFSNNTWKKFPLRLDGKVFLSKLYEDQSGHIWINGNGQGLIQLYQPVFEIIGKEQGLSSNNILSIEEGKHGDLFFTTACNGIFRKKASQSNYERYIEGCQNALFMDRKGRTWVLEKGITLIENGIKTRFLKESGLHSRTVLSIMEDSSGDIWVGTRQAIHKYDNQKFKKYLIPGVEQFDRVFNILEIHPNQFLLALTSGKLFWFEKNSFLQISFPSDQVTKLYEDAQKNLWVATSDQGLFLLDTKEVTSTPNWKNLTAENPQLPNSIYQLNEDKRGYLWGIDNQNQIFNVAIEELKSTEQRAKVNFFTINHGLPLIDLNIYSQPYSALLEDGHLIFPNIFGAIQINPSLLNNELDSFPILISSLNDSIVNQVQIQHNLNYGANDIKFSVQGIDLQPNSPKEYRYQINQKGWVVLPSGKDVSINNLAHGKNIIQIGGRFKNGDWIGKNATIHIEVPPLIYQTFWFWVIAFILGTIFVSSLIYWRTGIVKRQRNILAKKVDEQTKEIEAEKRELQVSLEKQKDLTNQLNASQASKNRMYAQISHEFKSPLQSVKGILLNNKTIFSEKDQNRAISNVENLISISSEIMELSKAESGKLIPKKNWYNIQNVIEQQIQLIQPQAENKNIQLNFDTNKSTQYLYFDLSMMQKVLGNLLSNAIKFSSENSSIIIESKNKKDIHSVAIQDNGAGIPPKELHQLTDPYFKASNNTVGGTGIGLSLVKEILELHHSVIQIKSQLGQGSSFQFSLPLPNDSEKKQLRAQLKSGIVNQFEKLINKSLPIILAVDDSEDILYFIDQTLHNQFNILQAKNGAQALEILETVKPNLIISDVNMPIMDGITLLGKIRNNDQFNATPVIFLTGSASEKTEIEGIQSGVDAILKKPVNESRLKAQINQLLKRTDNIKSSLQSAFVHNLLPKNIINDDLLLMKEIETLMLEHISDNSLKSIDFANMMGLGEKTLRNRVKKITSFTFKEYLRNFRLEKAKILIEEGYGTFGEIAVATGHSSLAYFSRRYKIYFGYSPNNSPSTSQGK